MTPDEPLDEDESQASEPAPPRVRLTTAREVRPETIHLRQLEPLVRQERAFALPSDRDLPKRPATRAGCAPFCLPCPWCGILVVMRVQPIHTEHAEKRNVCGSDGASVRTTDRAASGRDVARNYGNKPDVADAMRLRNAENRERSESPQRSHDKLRMSQPTARHVRHVRVQRVGSDASEVYESEEQNVSELRRTWHIDMPAVVGEGRIPTVLHGHGEEAVASALSRSEGEQRKLRTEQLPLGNSQAADQEQTHISCPSCRGRVWFNHGVGGADWHWIQYREGAIAQGVDARQGGTYTNIADHCRPCVRVSCRYNLYLDVSPATGSLKLNFPDLEPGDMEHSCTLDVADEGGATLEQVAQTMNMVRERVRQIEEEAFVTMVRNLPPDPDRPRVRKRVHRQHEW